MTTKTRIGGMPKNGTLFRHALMLASASALASAALLTAFLAFASTEVARSPQVPAAAPGTTPEKAFNDLVSGTCTKCYNATDWAGGVAMDTMDLAHPGQDDPEVWEKAIGKLRGRMMPPAS